jgi:hypothetical protein
MIADLDNAAVDILVRRDDLRGIEARRAAIPDAAMTAGHARLAIDRFAFTANNITYAAFGERMSYWDFFPAPQGFGIIPVWGFADVIDAGDTALQPGERIFGYFPMSSQVVLRPERVSESRFVDASPHRAELPPVYNVYERVAGDPAYAREREPHQMLLRPLFMTSFLIEDFISDNDHFGARRVLIASASSKTALGVAFAFREKRYPGLEIVALTSRRNRAFVESTGYYDRAVAYDEIGALDAATPSALIDMAGNVDVVRAVHERLGPALAYSMGVGGTHWENLAPGAPMPGPKPRFFFAPSQIRKRREEWGPGGLETRFAGVWPRFLDSAAGWLTFDELFGAEAVARGYRETVEGSSDPARGLIMSLTRR